VTTTRFGDGLERVEDLLRQAYEAQVPSGLSAVLDGRVAASIEGEQPWNKDRALDRRAMPAWARVRGRRSRRTAASLAVVASLLLIAAVMAIGHAVSPGYFEPGSYTWRNAQELGLTETTDGYQLTLERIYADVNQIVVAVSVSDLEGRGDSVAIEGFRMSDSAGVDWQVTTATMNPSPTSGESILYLVPAAGPVPAGRRDFTFSLPVLSVSEGGTTRRVEVDRTFTAAVDVRAGLVVSSLDPASSGGVTVTVDRVVIAPSMVEIDLRWDGLPSAPPDGPWSPMVELRHNGHAIDMFVGQGPIEGQTWIQRTAGGAEDPAGTWTVTVTEFWFDGLAPGPTATPSASPSPRGGPWVIEFSVP
jgi:hypothetical protein